MVDGVGALFSRHNFKAQPDVVPLMFSATEDDAWPRGLAYGRYVHNVLIVNHGHAQIRTAVHVVEHVERLDLGDTTCKHLDDPVAFAIQLDDGSEYELAIERADNPVPVPAEHYRRIGRNDSVQEIRLASDDVVVERLEAEPAGQRRADLFGGVAGHLVADGHR